MMAFVVAYSVIVGAAIRLRRRGLHLTMDTLAVALDLSRSGYSRLETGDTVPSIEQLRRIATALGTTAATLVIEASKIEDALFAAGVLAADDGAGTAPTLDVKAVLRAWKAWSAVQPGAP